MEQIKIDGRSIDAGTGALCAVDNDNQLDGMVGMLEVTDKENRIVLGRYFLKIILDGESGSGKTGGIDGVQKA